MNWEEYRNKNNNYSTNRYQLIEVECPCCGQYIYKDLQVVLTSFPPKCKYICKNCNWQGSA